MKKTLLLLVCFWFSSVLLFAQSINWQWVQRSTSHGNGSDGEGWGVTTDRNNNVFVTGAFIDTVFFAPDTLLNTLRDGNLKFYIVKYDSAGNVLWAKKASGPDAQWGFSLATDTGGSVYVTGPFWGDSITFDNITVLRQGTLSYPYNENIFIAKYDGAGNVLWAKGIYGNGDQSSNGIATDLSGNVYVTGNFLPDSISVGSMTLHNATDTGYTDAFVLKYDALGNVVWVKDIGGDDNDAGTAVATDNNGNLFVCGFFNSDSIKLDAITLHNTQTNIDTNNPYHQEMFIVKYDAAGQLLWAQNTIGIAEGANIATDETGNLYTTEMFYGDSINFGNTILHNTAGSGSIVSLIAKFDSLGTVQWVKKIQAPGFVYAYNVAASANGNVFVNGQFRGATVTCDSTVLVLPAGSYDPMFIFTLNTQGDVVCDAALTSGGEFRDGICADRSGNAIIIADFEVDPFVIGPDTLHIIGGTENVFVARLKCDTSQVENVNDLAKGSWLQIYPNPFSAQATAKYSLPASAKNAALIVYDLLGRESASYKLPDAVGQVSINANNISPGIYFYSLVADGNILAVRKMVIE